MLELLAVFVIAAVLGGVAGGVAAFTHRLFIAKEIAELKAWKASQEKGEATLVAGLKELEKKF